MQDFFFKFFFFFFILTLALLLTFLHVQTLVGMSNFRKDVGSPLLRMSACHTASARLDYSWGILMSLFILFSFPVADGLYQWKSWRREEEFSWKTLSKNIVAPFPKPSMSYEG